MIEETCLFCKHPIASLTDYLVLNDHYSAWPQAFYAHPQCCDEHDPFPFTYGVQLIRIVKMGDSEHMNAHGCESLYGWQVHLGQKNWVTTTMLGELERAHYVAIAIRARLSSPRPPTKQQRVRDAREKVTGKVRAYVFARDGHQCKKCGAPPPLVVDHIMPVSKGGSGEPDNLQSLCWDCNSAKGAKLELVQ